MFLVQVDVLSSLNLIVLQTHSGLFGTSTSENTLWKLEDLQNILNLSMPQTRVQIVKMDSSCGSIRSALETIY